MEKDSIIINKLDLIKAELDCIREHIIDCKLSDDDINSLKEAEKDLKQGKTKRL